MIKSGHLKKGGEDALQIILKAASDLTQTLKKSFIITIIGGKGISYYTKDNFCKTSTYSTKELIVQAHQCMRIFTPGVLRCTGTGISRAKPLDDLLLTKNYFSNEKTTTER